MHWVRHHCHRAQLGMVRWRYYIWANIGRNLKQKLGGIIANHMLHGWYIGDLTIFQTDEIHRLWDCCQQQSRSQWVLWWHLDYFCVMTEEGKIKRNEYMNESLLQLKEVWSNEPVHSLLTCGSVRSYIMGWEIVYWRWVKVFKQLTPIMKTPCSSFISLNEHQII